MPDARLYDTDVYAWTQEQAAALRRMAEARANTELDLEHLAEAIEDIGGSDLRALESDLARIIEHLLKLEHSPATDPGGHGRCASSSTAAAPSARSNAAAP